MIAVSKGVSREEWMWRGLAIAMCLAIVGMAVMPMAVGDAAYSLDTFLTCWSAAHGA